METSLTGLKLHDSIIASLYHHSLVELETPAPTVKKNAPPLQSDKISFLGNNSQRITVAVNYSQHAFLPENSLALLIKMLGACKLNTGDAAIINISAAKISIEALQAQLEPKKLLLLGVTPADLDMPGNGSAFTVQEWAGLRYLCAPELDQLLPETDQAKSMKTKLWVCLKQLFDIK